MWNDNNITHSTPYCVRADNSFKNWQNLPIGIPKPYLHNIDAHWWKSIDIYSSYSPEMKIQSTLVISNTKGITETLRDIRTSTYQSWESEENNKLNNHI